MPNTLCSPVRSRRPANNSTRSRSSSSSSSGRLTMPRSSSFRAAARTSGQLTGLAMRIDFCGRCAQPVNMQIGRKSANTIEKTATRHDSQFELVYMRSPTFATARMRVAPQNVTIWSHKLPAFAHRHASNRSTHQAFKRCAPPPSNDKQKRENDEMIAPRRRVATRHSRLGIIGSEARSNRTKKNNKPGRAARSADGGKTLAKCKHDDDDDDGDDGDDDGGGEFHERRTRRSRQAPPPSRAARGGGQRCELSNT